MAFAMITFHVVMSYVIVRKQRCFPHLVALQQAVPRVVYSASEYYGLAGITGLIPAGQVHDTLKRKKVDWSTEHK